MSLFEFVLIALAIEVTPGPNMAWLALLSAQRGRVAGLGAVAGVTLGMSLLAVLSSLGVATVVAAYPVVTQVIRWAGVAFLIYLALEAWYGWDHNPEASSDIRLGFSRGFIVNLLNPKAAAVFVILVPNAIGPGNGTPAAIILFSLIYICVATTVHIAIVLLGSMTTTLYQNPRREREMRWAAGILLIASAVWFAISTNHVAAAG
jgi:threonine/homoserine/homoserine lactone efflux protein